MELPDRAICPWHGGVCPGPELCAPAVMDAAARNVGRSPAEQPAEPVCPIVERTASNSILSQALIPLLLGEGAEDATLTSQDVVQRALMNSDQYEG